jgi:hypothetical protein
MSYRAKAIARTSAPDRWMVEVRFRDGASPWIFVVEELEQIDERIELGPDWRTIDQIVITLNRPILVPTPEPEAAPHS